jgi:hypothetical protein
MAHRDREGRWVVSLKDLEGALAALDAEADRVWVDEEYDFYDGMKFAENLIRRSLDLEEGP